MKSILLKKFSILAIGMISIHAFANTNDDGICENNHNLPSGYAYTEFTNNCQYSENLTVVRHGDKYGYADKNGKIHINAQFDKAHGFDEGLALVQKDGKYGFIDNKGSFIITPQFDDAWSFWGGRAQFLANGKYGFIDKKGKVVISPVYERTGNWFEEGLINVQKDGKWGYLDKNGKTKIPFDYDMAYDFSDGLAVVGNYKDASKSKMTFGYIDKNGKTKITQKYDAAGTFFKGSAMVTESGKMYFIDKNGDTTEPDFSQFQ